MVFLSNNTARFTGLEIAWKKGSGKPECDVGFAVSNKIVKKKLEQEPVPINDRIFQMRIPLFG